jgi:hypothetical protein
MVFQFRSILEEFDETVQVQLSAIPFGCLSGRPWNRFESLTLLVSVASAALSVCGVAASAQVETGQIAETVIDQTSAAVPDAAVAIKNLSTSKVRNTVSSSFGAYLALGLETDIYPVTVSSMSFKNFGLGGRRNRWQPCDPRSQALCQ